MQKRWVLGFILGVILTGTQAVSANGNQYRVVDTQPVTKQTYINKNSQSQAIWNAKHTKVVDNLKNHPQTTWYVTKMITMQHQKKNSIFAQIKSANGRHQGIVWHGYLKLGNYFHDFDSRYHSATIVNEFNQAVVQKRAKQLAWNRSIGEKDNWLTIISPKFNQISDSFMKQLNANDYRYYKLQITVPHMPHQPVQQTLDLAWAWQNKYRRAFNLYLFTPDQYGYVNLKGHLTEKQVVKALSKQIIRTGSNGELYSSDTPNQVMYTGAAVRFDKKNQAVYMTASMGINYENDMTVHSQLK